MPMPSEVNHLILIIIALIVVYGGVMFWTKHAKQQSDAKAGGPGVAGVGMDVGGLGLGEAEADEPGVGPKKNSERFNLTGRDAENAAKVLKRMLKQGRESE